MLLDIAIAVLTFVCIILAIALITLDKSVNAMQNQLLKYELKLRAYSDKIDLFNDKVKKAKQGPKNKQEKAA
jgi:predicted Holliday junction resolvase-like endonuclease